MTWKTHIVLGAVAGYCAYPSWKGILVGSTMALFPDIDKANSKAGKWIWPISWLVEKGLGHRTLTHSWVILLLPVFLIGDQHVALAALYGLLSHLISDSIVGRIQLLWPLKKGWFGIPLPHFLYRFVDKVTFIGAWVYIIYLAFIEGIGFISRTVRPLALAMEI